MNITVISNSELCIPLLTALHQPGARVSVFSSNTEVNNVILTAFCQSRHIPLITGKLPDAYPSILQQKPDMILVIDYDSKIDTVKLKQASKGIYNIHFSDLPRYRGASPVFWQIKNSEPSLGITIHQLTEKMDAGGMFWQKKIPNEPWYSYTIANHVLSQVAVEGVIRLIKASQLNVPLSCKPQDDSGATVFRRPGLADIMIDWNTDAVSILSLIRACNDWNKGAITVMNGNEIKIVDAFIGPDRESIHSEPGVITDDEGLYISVAAGFNKTICITAMHINQVFVPARFAAKFGLKKNTRFQNTLQVQQVK